MYATCCVTATHGPGHLDERIEAFLTSFAARLDTMSVDEVDDNRQSLIAAKTQKDHTLVDEADRNWEQISSKRCPLLLLGAGLSWYLSVTYGDYDPTFSHAQVPV